MLRGDQIRNWLRKFEGIRPFVDAAGSAWPLLAFLGGATLVTLLVGFFKEHPAIALACATIVAYFGFLIFEKVTAWLRRDTLDHKLEYAGSACGVARADNEDKRTVIVSFAIVNHADYDIYIRIDEEEFSLGNDRAKPEISQTVQIIPAKGQLSQGSLPITTAFPLAANFACSKLTLRFGRRKDKLEMRWFVVADTFIDAKKTGREESTPSEYIIRHNDFEWLST